MSVERDFHLGRPSAGSVGAIYCGFDTHTGPVTHRGYDKTMFTCKLPEGHDGEHDPGANWRGRFQVRDSGSFGFEIEGRHDHGWTSVPLRSREDVERLRDWLARLADEKWPG